MQDFQVEIEASHEDRHREFKRSTPWAQLKWKIARTAMAMANTRDGGLIIVGVEEGGDGYIPAGLTDADMATFDDDGIQQFINRFADPYVSCTIYRPKLDNNRQFLVLKIDEFREQPVVCKKSGEDGLREGAIYVRSRQKPESCVVRSQTEMRELLDLAIERGVRNFVKRATGAGVQVQAQPSDDELFEKERQSFIQRLAESRSLKRGSFVFTIRPIQYDEHRIEPLNRTLQIVREHQVRWFGWAYPLIYREEEVTDQKSAGSPASPSGFSDFYRLFQSGQFIYATSYREDQNGQEPIEYLSPFVRQRAPHEFKPSGVVNFHTIILSGMLTCEFAARLATKGLFTEQVKIGLLLTNTSERVLISTDMRRPVDELYRTVSPKVEAWRDVALNDLAADSANVAAPIVAEVLQKFGVEDATEDAVQRLQESLFQ